MDFKISTDINMDILIFGCQYSIIHTSMDINIDIQAGISRGIYPCKDILQWISVNNKHPLIDINVLWISVFNYSYPCFYGHPFGYPWISVDIHAPTWYGFSIQGYTF